MDRTKPNQMKLLSNIIYQVYKKEPYLLVPRLLGKLFDVPEKTIYSAMKAFEDFPFVTKPNGRINAGNYLLNYLIMCNPNNGISGIEELLNLKDLFINKSPYYTEADWKSVEEIYTENLCDWEER